MCYCQSPCSIFAQLMYLTQTYTVKSTKTYYFLDKEDLLVPLNVVIVVLHAVIMHFTSYILVGIP